MSFLISTSEKCDERKTTYFAKLVMKILADTEIDAADKSANEDERVDAVAETTDVCKIETAADAADDEGSEGTAETREIEEAADLTEVDQADGATTEADGVDWHGSIG